MSKSAEMSKNGQKPTFFRYSSQFSANFSLDWLGFHTYPLSTLRHEVLDPKTDQISTPEPQKGHFQASGRGVKSLFGLFPPIFHLFDPGVVGYQHKMTKPLEICVFGPQNLPNRHTRAQNASFSGLWERRKIAFWPVSPKFSLIWPWIGWLPT